MKRKIAAGALIAASLTLTGCGFFETENSENPESSVVEEATETAEETSGADEENQITTEDVDLTEALQDDGRIIFAPTFAKTETGGIETILLEEGATDEQVQILRNRLIGNSTMQENGLAMDPADIYGADIPGISYLSENRDKYETIYTEVPLGGSVEYRSSDEDVIKAIHEWIDYSLRSYRPDDSETGGVADNGDALPNTSPGGEVSNTPSAEPSSNPSEGGESSENASNEETSDTTTGGGASAETSTDTAIENAETTTENNE